VVVTFGILLAVMARKHIVACAGESVRTHPAVVLRLISGLTVTRKTHDHLSARNVRIVNDIAAFGFGDEGRIYDHGAHQVAHIRCFAAGGMNFDAVFTHVRAKLFGAFDEGFDDFAGDEVFVSSDGRRQHKWPCNARAEQIVGVHHNRILGDAFPHGEVAGFTPIQVCEAAFGACAIGVHDVTIIGVVAQHIGHYLAKSFWK